mmetsp:Transcript_56864/g.133613  ORF Transcript_56864/g.133613 Transcript_56864/m.133613 type:complete len:745 (+) Transcript_56864:47-2281(+)
MGSVTQTSHPVVPMRVRPGVPQHTGRRRPRAAATSLWLLLLGLACIVAFSGCTRRLCLTPPSGGVTVSDQSPDVNVHNESEGVAPKSGPSGFSWQLRLRLWRLRARRKHLLRIVQAEDRLRRALATADDLESRGPDGSNLLQASKRSGEGPRLRSVASSGVPKEIEQLQKVEERIRKVRHALKIKEALQLAAQTSEKLFWFRLPPLLRHAPSMTLMWLLYQFRDDVSGWLQTKSDILSTVQLDNTVYLALSQMVPMVRSYHQLFRGLRTSATRKVSQTHRVPHVQLSEVAGMGGAKAEALEIIECLVAPTRFARVGAKCPKGLLLTGPPGCGKTMLAKAMASTAAVPFLSVSGSDFNRKYAGEGTMLVKALFRAAREAAPSVLFIDELDYIGRKRSSERGGGLETDRSAALTQLLTEMDGFSASEGVLVIATTNRKDILDDALLRPGRFDRKVSVPLPDVQGRLQILKSHAKRLPLEPMKPLTGNSGAVDFEQWARRTSGFSGADLAGLVNEAALAAARDGCPSVTEMHMQSSYSKRLIGIPSERRPSSDEMNLTAMHEAGHAVVHEAVRAALEARGISGFSHVAHISIVPTGDTGGNTQYATEDESQRPPATRRVLMAQMAAAMGGLAGEEYVYGKGQSTTGASSDLRKATRIAEHMVEGGGLSSAVGPRALSSGEVSEALRRTKDMEVERLLREALGIARAAVYQNRKLMEAVASDLARKETMQGPTFQSLVDKHGIQAPRL